MSSRIHDPSQCQDRGPVDRCPPCGERFGGSDRAWQSCRQRRHSVKPIRRPRQPRRPLKSSRTAICGSKGDRRMKWLPWPAVAIVECAASGCDPHVAPMGRQNFTLSVPAGRLSPFCPEPRAHDPNFGRGIASAYTCMPQLPGTLEVNDWVYGQVRSRSEWGLAGNSDRKSTRLNSSH